MSFYIIDGSNWFWRFFHAPMTDLSVECKRCHGFGSQFHHPEREEDNYVSDCDLCNGTGREPTKAVWLFTKELLKLLREKEPKRLAVVFDGPRSELRRRQIYPKYKTNRGSDTILPEAKQQLKRIRQIIQLLGICHVQCEGYEADDAIASLAVQYKQGNVRILSRDKDLRQLCIHPHIIIQDPMTGHWSNSKNAGDKWGIQTQQIQDFLILMGDSSDCIPGIGGVGEKTAAKLLQRYANIEDIMLGGIMGHLPDKLANKICKAGASGWIKTSRQLIALDTTLNLNIDPLALNCPKVNLRRAAPVFAALGFKNME